MPSFSIPLSGLNSNSQALSVIANNLANLNTTGFKTATPRFRDLFYQQVGSTGSGNPVQVGVGSRVGSIPTLFTQGSVESTGVETDLAIQGNGFFIVEQGGLNIYTRAGNFSVDSNGFLIDDDGGFVLGFPGVNGVVNTNQTIAPLAVSTGLIAPPNATTNVLISMNLDSNSAVGDTFSTAVAVFDPLGATHILTYNFTRITSAGANQLISSGIAGVGTAIQGGTTITISDASLTPNTVSFTSDNNIYTLAASAGTFDVGVDGFDGGTLRLQSDLNALDFTIDPTTVPDGGDGRVDLVDIAAAINIDAGNIAGQLSATVTGATLVIEDTRGGSITLTNGLTYDDGGVAGTAFQSTTETQALLTLGDFQSAIDADANFSVNFDAGGNLTISSANGTAVSFSGSLLTSTDGSSTLVWTAAAGSNIINDWNYDITIPALDLGGLATDPPVNLTTGRLTFDGTGTLTVPASDVGPIPISGFSNGAASVSFSWQIFDAAGIPIVTQVAAPSSTSTIRQDGFASGTLLSFSFQGDGIIQGIFTNGQTLALGQLAMANFPNVQGLLRSGGNGFLASISSGAANVGVPGTGGRGTVSGGALELSNVDIAQEFAKLILAQRGYQANARTFTTFDEVTQETINLKR